MRRLVLLFAAICVPVLAADSGLFWNKLKREIESLLGRPYVWGATGLKSFDCSGFVWRVMYENDILLKRTTARKLYFSLPRAKDPYQPGNLVFFNDLKHVGIVAGPSEFYHAETSVGTNKSNFDPYWRQKVCGFGSIQRADQR